MSESEQDQYIVKPEEAGLRLDEFLHKKEEVMPIAALRRAIEAGDVKVNGNHRSSGWRVRVGDRVDAAIIGHRHRMLQPEDVSLEILYEDRFLIAINKPPGMLSHPTAKERTGTVVNALIHYLRSKGDRSPRPSLVHRLDRETSGVLLVAREEKTLAKVSIQFHERQVTKKYEAIVFGTPPTSGEVDAPIGYHPALWPKWRVMEKDSKPARSSYLVKAQMKNFAHLELQPHTGRTHQLRIHMSHIGHPIVGDHTYGRTLNKDWQTNHPDYKVARHLLHAASLNFYHPVQEKQILLQARLPEDMEQFLKFAREDED